MQPHLLWPWVPAWRNPGQHFSRQLCLIWEPGMQISQGRHFLCLQMNLHFYTLGAFSERDLALETAFLFSLSKACNLIVMMSLAVNCLVLSMLLLSLPCCSFKQALPPGECFSLLSALPCPHSLSIWLNWSAATSHRNTRVILSWNFPDEISLFINFFLTHPYSKFEALGGI